MKILAIIIAVLVIGLTISGCSNINKKDTSNQNDAKNVDIETENINNLNVDEESIANPDIGTLDDITVSDEVPE